jgi:glycopeptide antibiotics resistance protein
MQIPHNKKLLWILASWLLILNLIPIGNSTSSSLSANKLFVFRLDYLLHSFTFLAYAWLWIWGKIARVKWFTRHELAKYGTVVLLSAIGFEFAQLLVPWRTFNPVDLYYNLIGTALALAFIFVSQLLSTSRSTD